MTDPSEPGLYQVVAESFIGVTDNNDGTFTASTIDKDGAPKAPFLSVTRDSADSARYEVAALLKEHLDQTGPSVQPVRIAFLEDPTQIEPRHDSDTGND